MSESNETPSADADAASSQKYICVNCGYVYDPEAGDPMNDIPPGTAFEDLPEEWVCPICYATTDLFDQLD